MRREFTRKTKRDALKRSEGMCEGDLNYNKHGVYIRCNAPLSKGVEFDHWIMDAIGGDNSLENCICLCIPCHREKTQKHDIPRAAKVKRISDKHTGITRQKKKWPKRGFGEWKDNSKQLRDL